MKPDGVMRPAWNAKPNVNLLAAPGTVYLTVLFCLIPQRHARGLAENVHAPAECVAADALCGSTKATNLIKVAARQQTNEVVSSGFALETKHTVC